MNATADVTCCASKDKSSLLCLLGVLLIVIGILAIAAPAVAGVTTVWVLGGLMAVAGVLRLLGAFHAASWGAGALRMLWGVFTVLCAALVLTHPMFSAVALTLILACYFVIQGIMEIVLALRIKPRNGWGWLLFNGLLALVLGWLIWREWPLSGMWAIGTLLGINFLFNGWSLIAARPVCCK